MAIPKYNEIMPRVLDELAKPNIDTIDWKSLEEPIAKVFNLSEEELATEYDTGNGRIFLDRISWALSYLSIAKLIERPKRGHCTITDAGRSLHGNDEAVLSYVKEKVVEREARKAEARSNASIEEETTTLSSDITPDEAMNQAANKIRESVCEDLLDTIISKTPYEFEKLVVKLLDKMGYGGIVKDAGQVTQQSNDGGIDGIIKEDVLGLGRIHIQAKRYKRENTIGREDVQKFVGALAVAQSNKGVFITTSSYSKGAMEYVVLVNPNRTLYLENFHS